jgi:hypothetical protein
LEVLKQTPELLEVYRALGRIALRQLPVANAGKLKKMFGGAKR